jgi:hypothetical protein
MQTPVPVATPVSGDHFMMAFAASCGLNVSKLSLLENTKIVTGAIESIANGTDIHWIYKLDHVARLTGIGLYVSTQNDCYIDFYQTDMGTDPQPQQPSKPERHHCEKVAFNLHYEYGSHFNQVSAIEGDPCFVFLRFKDLHEYRFFLDDRRTKGKSPDEEILQPENVRVELEHRVGTS